ncbi:MAG: tetratricopeptide repeat protein [Chlamydiales bacterium]|jgi:predicted Zn-dependent protease|nr:tetratricopeptide repeat protein [Chlamydiales bacterium]
MGTHSLFWDELAIQSYKKILKEKPKNALAHTHLGMAYIRTERFNKAIRSFERALQADKTHAEAYYHLGRAYQLAGKRDQALRSFTHYNQIMGERRISTQAMDEMLEEWT